MTELTITPKVSDKTARFKGTVAAGEHVAVTIKGGAEWLDDDDGANLTLRLIDLTTKRTLAVFPRPAETLEENDESEDAWGSSGDDLTCTLNLNTLRMVAAARHMLRVPVLFVLGDTDAPRTLYFCDRYEVGYWPERIGDDVPYDLDRWPKKIDEWMELVEGWTAQMSEFSATLSNHTDDTTRHITAAERTLWNGKANQSALGAEQAARAAADATEAAARADADDALQASKANKSDVYTKEETDDAIEDAIGSLVNDAPAALDTLKEVADWIADDQSGAAAMAADIAAAKSKLAGIAEGANNYTLPAATASTLGGIKVGANLTMAQDGTLSATGGAAVTVDSALSATSENPVQNKVVKSAVDAKCSLADVTRTEDVWSFPAEWQGLLYAPSQEWVEENGDRSKRYYTIVEPDFSDGTWNTHVRIGIYYDDEDGIWDAADSYDFYGYAAEDATTIVFESPYDDPDITATRHVQNANGLARLSDLPPLTNGLIGADFIATNNPAFVTAVTNCPVAIAAEDAEALTEWGIYGGGGTIGALLAALAAAVAALKKKKMPLYPVGGTGNPVNATIENGVLTVSPFAMAAYTPTANAAFSVAMGALPNDLESGKARDAVLVIDCTSLTDGQEPTMTWDTHYHPRTDAGTDFACVAGAKNVYYISEYATGEFAVGGWTETEGGNT